MVLRSNVFHDIIDPARPRKFLTLIYVLDQENKSVLLGQKTRGFGKGNWNAFGGKFDTADDIDIRSSAQRELREECRLHVPVEKLRHDGILYYSYTPDLQPQLFEVHCFSVFKHDLPLKRRKVNAKTGEEEQEEEEEDQEDNVEGPGEGEPPEMDPLRWYSMDTVPIQEMWADDEYWLQEYLARNLYPQHENNSHSSGGGPNDSAVADMISKSIKSVTGDSLQFVAAFQFEGYTKIVQKRVVQL